MISLTAALEVENRNQVLTTRTRNMIEALTAFRQKHPPHYSGGEARCDHLMAIRCTALVPPMVDSVRAERVKKVNVPVPAKERVSDQVPFAAVRARATRTEPPVGELRKRLTGTPAPAGETWPENV